MFLIALYLQEDASYTERTLDLYRPRTNYVNLWDCFREKVPSA